MRAARILTAAAGALLLALGAEASSSSSGGELHGAASSLAHSSSHDDALAVRSHALRSGPASSGHRLRPAHLGFSGRSGADGNAAPEPAPALAARQAQTGSQGGSNGGGGAPSQAQGSGMHGMSNYSYLPGPIHHSSTDPAHTFSISTFCRGRQ